MALHFPEENEVRLGAPPLAEVICQTRFPPILRITEEPPTRFQEAVRRRFPNLETEHGMVMKIPGPGRGGAPLVEPGPTTYRFLSTDRASLVSLTQEFYAVSTKAYTHWNDFADVVRMVNSAVREVYAPAHATRIGLRYINRFTPSNSGRESIDEVIRELRPELTALVATDAWSEPADLRTRLTLTDDDSGRLTVQTSLESSQEDPAFTVDFDYFEEGELPLDEVLERCERYHEVLYRAFRWAVGDTLHAAFHPE